MQHRGLGIWRGWLQPSDSTRVGRGLMWLRRLGPVGPMALAASVLPPLGGLILLGSSVAMADWFRDQGVLGLSLFVMGLSVLAGLALLPTYAQAIVCGWIFGLAAGLPAAVLGFMGAAAIGYTIVRRCSADRAVDLIEENPKARAVYRALAHRGFWRSTLVVALIRLPPNSPFGLTNVLLGSLRVPVGCFLLGTLVGMTPRVAAAVVIGAGVSNPTQPLEQSPWVVTVGIVITVGVLVLLGRLARRALTALGDPAP
jgi:uncharacterized membrane protein YdjX (TVP38/TMEM64 family)